MQTRPFLGVSQEGSAWPVVAIVSHFQPKPQSLPSCHLYRPVPHVPSRSAALTLQGRVSVMVGHKEAMRDPAELDPQLYASLKPALSPMVIASQSSLKPDRIPTG